MRKPPTQAPKRKLRKRKLNINHCPYATVIKIAGQKAISVHDISFLFHPVIAMIKE